jgi:hypothetical protein
VQEPVVLRSRLRNRRAIEPPTLMPDVFPLPYKKRFLPDIGR